MPEVSLSQQIAVSVACSANPRRVALVLRGRQFIRSWLESGLVSHLRSDGIDVVIYADSETREVMSAEESQGVVLLADKLQNWFSKNSRLIGLHEMRKKSSTHQFRLHRMLLSDYWVFPRVGTPYQRLIGGVYGMARVIRSVKRNFLELLYLVPLVRHIAKLLLSLGNWKGSDSSLDFAGFDWLIIPSAGVGSESDLIAAAKRCSVRSLVAIDNWDHLTAKGAFVELPDFITVMGSRDIGYARDLHGADPESVLVFGLPRFDVYRETRLSIQNSSLPHKPKVIYLGWSLPHSEARVVSNLFNRLKSDLGSDKFHFAYRPHPRNALVKDPFILDDAGITVVRFEKNLRTDMPKMDDDFMLELTSADVVVGPPTTMMLEAAILGRPCVLDLTIDSFHRTTAGFMSLKCLHHKDLIGVSTISKAANLSELASCTKSYLGRERIEIKHEISHLFDVSDDSYRNLLSEFLRRR